MKYKNIFITGASTGIGEALSIYYAAPGVTLGLVALNSEKQLETVAARCRDKGAEVCTYLADVSEGEVIKNCVMDFLSRIINVDLVIANAGVALIEDMDFLKTEIPMENMSVNYFGVINTFLPFLPAMKERRAGHLSVISSISSIRSTHNSGAYSASKAAINLWTEGLRLRLLPYGIPVTTLCVGFVDTAMTKGNSFWMPGIISAQEAAKLIASAIRRQKRLMILPWQSRIIWTFFHILPGRLYDIVINWAKAKQS